MLSTEVSTQQIQNEWQKNTRQVQLSESLSWHGICLYICVCVCVYIYIYIYIHVHACQFMESKRTKVTQPKVRVNVT